MESVEKSLIDYLNHQSAMVMLRVDDKGVIVHANTYACKLAGMELKGQPSASFFTDFNTGFEPEEILKKNISQRLLNVNSYHGLPETLYFTSYRTQEGFLLIGEANHIEIQELKKTMITLNNELNNLTRELQKKNIQLDQLNQLKNQFLGMAAHDLRNPIGSIMMFSEFILEEQCDAISDELKQIIEIIKSSSSFMLHLLDELLDVVKIESGKLELNYEKTDINGFLRNNIAVNSIIAGKKKIKIILNLPETLPVVEFDRNKIEQVLNNLISNAIKFSFQETTITVNAFSTDNEIVINVSDQGQGIPTEEMDKLFKPFSKLSPKGTAGEKSTGLGLSIAKRIIIGHLGRIWVESKVGEGTTFYFSLPLNKT